MSKNRILSLVLALVMVLGAFGTVFADTVSPAKTQEEAAAFLKDKGVLAGNAAGDLMLEQELRRRDSVILFSKLLNEFDVAKEFAGEPTYTDIKKEDGSFKDPAYVPFLKWGQENEHYVGKPNGEFGWDANLTAQEYSVVLLKSLGYTVNGEGSDVKWEEVTKFAKELGIFKGFETDEETKAILRGEMALMTFNALGVKVKGTDKTLAETLGIEMPEAPAATELTAKVLDTENLAEVVVEYSNLDLVESRIAKDIKNYRFTDGANADKLVIKSARIDENNVVLSLDLDNKENEALLRNRKYELTIRNVDRKVNASYEFTAKDDIVPTVEKVEVLGEYGIKVTTSEPIKNVDERNFRIDNDRVSMIVEQYGRDIILSPYHNAKFPEDAEELSIEGLMDFAKHKSAKVIMDIELVKDAEAPEVIAAEMTGSKLTVIFDKDVFHKSVKGYENRVDKGNVSYRDGRYTDYIYTTQDLKAKDNGIHKYARKIDTNVVVYEFDKELPRNVRVMLDGVANHSNVALKDIELDPTLVTDRSVPEIIKPVVGKMHRISKETLTLEFDKDLFEVEDLNTEKIAEKYFTVYQREVSRYGEDLASDVKVTAEIVDKYKVKVNFSGLKQNTENKDANYILEVRNFEDKTNLRNRMERTYIDFEYDPTPGKGFEIESAKVVKDPAYETEIEFKFTRPVNKSAAIDVKNYFFGPKVDLGQLGGEAIVERDGKTVTLVIPKSLKNITKDYNYIEILPRMLSIDATNNRLSGVRVFDFNKGLAAAIEVQNTATEAIINAPVSYNGKDDYEIDASGINADFTVKTGLAANITIKNVNRGVKVTVDTPKAHIIVPTGTTVHEINVKAISENSLEILGGVEKVVVSVDSLRIFGNVTNMNVVTTKDKAVVKVSAKSDDKPVEIKLEKGIEKEISVDKDGKVEEDLSDAQKEADEEALKKAEKQVADLFDKEELAEKTTSKDIANAKATVKALRDSKEKTDLLKRIEKAEALLAKADEEKEKEEKEEFTAAKKALENAIKDAEVELDKKDVYTAGTLDVLDKAVKDAEKALDNISGQTTESLKGLKEEIEKAVKGLVTIAKLESVTVDGKEIELNENKIEVKYKLNEVMSIIKATFNREVNVIKVQMGGFSAEASEGKTLEEALEENGITMTKEGTSIILENNKEITQDRIDKYGKTIIVTISNGPVIEITLEPAPEK